MRATAEPVEANLVRLLVEVEEPEVQKVLDDTLRSLSRRVRVPGFRPGKVPLRVLEARLGGPAAIRAEALREALPDFYARALDQASLDAIAPPEIEITGGQESGPVGFEAVVQVRPRIGIAGYEGLEVTLPKLDVSDDEVDVEVDHLRSQGAELVPVDRPATNGDNLTIDLNKIGAPGEEMIPVVEDVVYELGSGSAFPEMDEILQGASRGDVLTFHTSDAESGSPDETGDAGQDGTGDDVGRQYQVIVKEVKEKVLPELSDQWASEASEFATLKELRDDIAKRVAKIRVFQANIALRDGAVAALTGLVNDEDLPDVLVNEEVNERLHDLAHRLDERKVSLEDFYEATGQDPEKLLEMIKGEAIQAVREDLALRAVADAEDISVGEDELDEAIATMATRMDVSVKTLRSRLESTGRISAVRSEQRKIKARQWLFEHVSLVDEQGTRLSRDQLELADEQSELSDDIALEVRGDDDMGEVQGEEREG